MKQQLELMKKLLSDSLDVNDFYNIAFTEDHITFQGQANDNVLEKYRDLGYDFIYHKSDKWWLHETRNSSTGNRIRIVLTKNL